MLAGWGFVIWTLCSIGCGLAKGFWSFLVLRVIMGAGEASIVNLTGPYIDDVAPPKHKTMWFGILFLVSPLDCHDFSAGCRVPGAAAPLSCRSGLRQEWRHTHSTCVNFMPFTVVKAVSLACPSAKSSRRAVRLALCS